MKSVFFSVAFMLIGSFAFANNEIQPNKLAVNSETVVKSIDFLTFKEMVKNYQIKIIKRVDFIFYDSCGGAWHVTGGEGWSTWDITMFLWEWDGGC